MYRPMMKGCMVLCIHVAVGNVSLKGKKMKISAIMLAQRIEQYKAEKKEKVCITTENTTKPTIKLIEKR